MRSILPRFLPLLFLGLMLGCTEGAEQAPADQPAAPQDALDRGIAAHGGLKAWQSFASLEYDIDRGSRQEHHLIDLWDRRTLQTGDGYVFGFDGEQAWEAPNLDAFPGRASFSNGLDFYFFGIPFVLADPGANRDDLGLVRVGEKEYEAVKISYDAGIGASPNDYYIVHFDPETHQLEVLLYTATFRTQQPSENYNARVYEAWQEVNGLLVPQSITTYRWNAETRELGDSRGTHTFSNVVFSTEQPDAALFDVPAEAEVDAPATP